MRLQHYGDRSIRFVYASFPFILFSCLSSFLKFLSYGIPFSVVQTSIIGRRGNANPWRALQVIIKLISIQRIHSFGNDLPFHENYSDGYLTLRDNLTRRGSFFDFCEHHITIRSHLSVLTHENLIKWWKSICIVSLNESPVRSIGIKSFRTETKILTSLSCSNLFR